MRAPALVSLLSCALLATAPLQTAAGVRYQGSVGAGELYSGPSVNSRLKSPAFPNFEPVVEPNGEKAVHYRKSDSSNANLSAGSSVFVAPQQGSIEAHAVSKIKNKPAQGVPQGLPGATSTYVWIEWEDRINVPPHLTARRDDGTLQLPWKLDFALESVLELDTGVDGLSKVTIRVEAVAPPHYAPNNNILGRRTSTFDGYEGVVEFQSSGLWVYDAGEKQPHLFSGVITVPRGADYFTLRCVVIVETDLRAAQAGGGSVTLKLTRPVVVQLDRDPLKLATITQSTSGTDYSTARPRIQMPDIVGALDRQMAPLDPRAKVSLPSSGEERNTNRPGSDIRSFKASRPGQCDLACAKDTGCRAWTWVKPGVQGPSAVCWLKNSVPSPIKDGCCVSGTKS